MQSPIDELFSHIKQLSAAISDLPDNPERRSLERQRQQLRGEAAAISLKGRHPVSVDQEIKAIIARLETIDSMLITQGYQERRSGKNIQDPGAYSAAINRRINKQHADEVTALTERLDLLRSSLPDAHST